MTIEEIAAQMTQSSWQLWTALAAEVERQSIELDAMAPGGQTFHRVTAEAFRLERGEIRVIISRSPAGAKWTQIVSGGPDVRPVTNSGEIELAMGDYWLHGQKFSSLAEAARFLLAKLVP